MLQNQKAKQTAVQLVVTSLMLLCKVKIRNSVKVGVRIHSTFGLLYWQVQNISLIYWSIYFGKSIA